MTGMVSRMVAAGLPSIRTVGALVAFMVDGAAPKVHVIVAVVVVAGRGIAVLSMVGQSGR
ncbi:hypothetical protein [Ruania rhizosphaerae]|uniref:hypothetical protein n=1 Tax=Ruania rhizosphaerae TaxID=1840413 RepID=UPI001F402DB5|nr:hypothetical protein [Ruania rhizosphaerae]